MNYSESEKGMTYQRDLLILAALLHDIGKFAQRAGRPQNKAAEEIYCPLNKFKRHTHKHVLYTDYFIEHDMPLPPVLEQDRGKLARLAAAHHKPDQDNLMEMCISIADRLSSGAERIKDVPDEEESYLKARLVSIFDQISLDRHKVDPKDPKWFYRLLPIDDDPYPCGKDEAQLTDYELLFNLFQQKLNGLDRHIQLFDQQSMLTHFVDSVISLLEEYTWCIPSSTYKTIPDIPLFDHSTGTAAIAQALYAYHTEMGGIPAFGDRQPKFVLFGGDLSGIQSYIFSLNKSHGRGVAKLFRARSFYLQMLTRSVVLAVTQRLGLHPIAKIMDAGGKFILLLPATEKTQDTLEKLELDIQEWFFTRFKGELSMICSWDVSLDHQDLMIKDKRFQQKLDEFFESLEHKKLGKFHRLFEKPGFSPVIDFDYSEENFGNCQICQKNAANEQATKRFSDKHGSEMRICTDCLMQIEQIGTKLPKDVYTYVSLSRHNAPDSFPLFDGLYGRFCRSIEPRDLDAVEILNIRNRICFAYHPVAGHLPTIAEKDLSFWEETGRREGYEQEEGISINANMPKTFRLLAGEARIYDQKSKKERGKAFLGTLKADVDNLGFIFSIGLEDRLSMARFASLSRMLNYFFSDRLVRLVEQEYPNIYVVFAGGDDLFLLGPWTDIVAFTQRLGNEFVHYVAHNEDVTLSAGVSIDKPMLPIRAIADHAEALLEHAKDYGDDITSKKNAVSLFSTTVHWNDFNKLLEEGKWFEQLLLSEDISAGMANRLLHYGEQCRRFQEGLIRDGLYLSHMTYDLHRNLDEEKVAKEDFVRINALKNNNFVMKHMRLPMSYALYRVRRERSPGSRDLH